MSLFTAQVISVLFHPLVLTFITPFLLIVFFPKESSYSILWILYPLIFVGIVCIFTLYGVKTKLFSNFDITERSERKALYLFVTIVSFIYLFILFFLNGPKALMVLGVGILIGSIIFEFINIKLKASVHVGIVSAFLCSIALLYGGVFFIFPLFIPVVAWSRIHMKKHTLQETVIGGFVGTVLTVIIYLVIQYTLYIYA
jgi:putative transposase